MKSEKVRMSLLLTFSLLLFTSAAFAGQPVTINKVETAGAELNICCQGAGTGTLVATAGTGAQSIGTGVALLQVVSVTLTAEACDKIANVGPNIAVKLKSAGVEIPLELQGGSYVGYAAVGTDLQLLLVPPQGYGFGSHDGAIPLGTVGESDIRVTLQGVSLPTLIELSPVSYWVIEGETAVERTWNSYVEVSAATASLEDGL